MLYTLLLKELTLFILKAKSAFHIGKIALVLSFHFLNKINYLLRLVDLFFNCQLFISHFFATNVAENPNPRPVSILPEPPLSLSNQTDGEVNKVRPVNTDIQHDNSIMLYK